MIIGLFSERRWQTVSDNKKKDKELKYEKLLKSKKSKTRNNSYYGFNLFFKIFLKFSLLC
ncbi:MAG: hypothetical protein COV98_04725 [Candidatus Altarchaeum sp. CG12_big_fil_rev_8_21_14_0_65_33_22]|nr:MAG: hypothetical protein AUK59_05745 [Candidatus Altarchaeum sp. CG2_30_32_3053]PIN67104.1 MAG: hypothetical protein COV98_04725 [Candidatus Altarchaeum sp. CG12_big_fil_rev_8_21_14_0_65_33_22]PIV27060.1 MAG: hypothetical protein COS36_07040 [Candidatus Altarchaeum sp. CG03_land_8_20_14_0_80_32_618]PJC14732.1 MAG: hypothetical protein CO063_02280 [Candidatus Altarchaeum sp. CG_4_9_14_0_8_um_filter_32_206]